MPKRRSRKREEEREEEASAKRRPPRTAVEPKAEPRNTGGDGSGQIWVDQLVFTEAGCANYRGRDLKCGASSDRGRSPMMTQGEDISPTEESKKNLSKGDLWQAAFLVGTEWDQMDTVYKINWDFSNLEDAFEEGGALYGKTVYLFGCTEPQLVHFQDQLKMIWIPAVVVVVSPFPPSDKVGIKSILMEGESVVPMKKMKMCWVPYIPYNKRHLPLEQSQTRIHALKCTQRRAALKKLHEERIMHYQYCLPYFYHPLKEDETETNTVVTIIYPSEPPVVCDFDWALDNLEEFTADLVQEEKLAEDKVEDFKNFLKQMVKEEKKKQREAREARKKAIEEISPEVKAAFENMRYYKFYPVQTSNTPDISKWKSDYINRYYGHAHEVV